MAGASVHSTISGTAADSAAGRISEDERQAARRNQRARDHLLEEHRQPRRTGAIGGGRGRLPLEHPRLGDPQPHQRDRDRVHHLVGMARQQGQLQRDPDDVGPEIVDRGAQERGRRFHPGWTAKQLQQPQGDWQRDRGKPDRRPGQRAAGQHGPAEQEEQQRRRRRQAAPQVVENLPAGHQRQAIALEADPRGHEREQPQQNLPVAADPAMLTSRVREHARRVVVDDFDVGDQRGARVQSLEQVVREQCVFGHAAVERRRERVDVVQALAGEDAFLEQILIDVGDGGGVRVDAGVPGIRPREQRPGGAGHRHADAGLEDAIALGDAAQARVEPRSIQRVGDDADQGLRGVARQPRVGVQRDAIAHRRQDRQFADLHGEAGVAGAAEETVELLDLAPLALPSHPHLLAGIPAPFAMKQEEAIGVLRAEAPVERLDAVARRRENRRIAGHLARLGVGEVAEDREVNERVEIAEREHLHVLQQRRHRGDARQQRRHHHHGAGVVRHPLREVEAGQPPRRNRPVDHSLRERDRDVGSRDQQQGDDQGNRARRGGFVAGIRHRGGEQDHGHRAQSTPGRAASRARTPGAARAAPGAAGTRRRSRDRAGPDRSGDSRRARPDRRPSRRPPPGGCSRPRAAPPGPARRRWGRQALRPLDVDDRG